MTLRFLSTEFAKMYKKLTKKDINEQKIGLDKLKLFVPSLITLFATLHILPQLK